ncbi:MAG: hypothetical protein WCF30_13895 [Terracidiphilus sp.]
MSKFKVFGFTALAIALLCFVPSASAQVSIGVGIGVAPVCPYGYFDYPPYDCAPYGYYGPDWFVNDIFIGAGPWFHGPAHFSGHVDNRFDPRHGYKGPLPGRGEEPNNNFHGNEARDGHGHVVAGDHDASGEHALPGGGHGGHGGGGHH